MVFLPDQGVDFDDLDFVQLLDSRLDLVLVALDIDDEDQGVVVFNLLHSTLSGVGGLDDIVSVQVGPLGSRLPGVLGRTGRPEGAGTVYTTLERLQQGVTCFFTRRHKLLVRRLWREALGVEDLWLEAELDLSHSRLNNLFEGASGTAVSSSL